MPLLAVAAGRAMPDMAIGYITRKDKARYIDVQNLFIDEDYSAQFKETAARFGKYKDYGERKYYHFKLSPDRKDKADPLMVQEYAKACAEKMFEGCECVIATHTDTQTVHAHIIVNAVHPITGKKLHFNDGDYTRLKDMANEIGEEFGFSSLDFRKKAENKRTNDERHIILKGGTSWKEELREVIEEGRQAAATPEEFEEHLKLYGVEITQSGKDYSYLHPRKQKPIRGKRLGENYSKEEIEHFIGEKRHGRNTRPAYAIAGDERERQAGNSDGIAERSVSDIEREIEQLDRTAEQAHRGYAFGYSDDGVRADGNNRESRAGNQSDGGKDGAAEREHRNASRKGGFDFCK
ncbi:MAG: relaxase/mobilization nuclease domain-containing protein [Bacilli bacterium]|jgi:hypothetical protein|nr:relaxase/mobilization nuclease domain-containing protein [Staphylococcus sp.]